MTLLEKIRLSRKFGKTTYVISAILTVAMSLLVVSAPTTLDICILFKLFSIPVIWYLSSNLARGLGVYFYLNLGISRKEYWLIPFVVVGLGFCIASLLSRGILSAILGVIGFSCFWSILELFQQERRVAKGWFPSNPKKK